MSHLLPRALALVSAGITALGASAQTPRPDPQPAKVEKFTVTASPLNASETEMTQPVTILSDEDLRRRQAGSIGDTVSRELGVQSTSFGPASGRPVIRGLDGARVRVLQNGVDTLDVSSISPDHQVATDSLNARQIEILRGPASLLYGSGAIGGVVNVVNGLIAQEVPTAPTGAIDLRGGSANRERTGAFDVTAGAGNIAVNANGFSRDTRDYRIPGRIVRDDPDSPTGRLPNSDIDARGGGIGASLVGSRGYAGMGISNLRSDYGIPSPEAPRIAMEQTRWDGAAEIANPGARFTRLKVRAGYNDYEHRELEPSGEVGTTFTNKAWDTRLELAHELGRGAKGAFGAQFQDRDFAAIGEEAIIPKTNARSSALFAVQQKRWNAWTLEGGARFERETRKPEADLPSRRFSLSTVSAGLLRELTPNVSVTLNLTRAERAPSIEELYSNGPHHATQTFDIGDANLRKESSRNVDLTLRGKHGDVRWKASLFAARFRDYIHTASADADGDGIADRYDEEGMLAADGEFLAQFTTQANARFHGAEAEWRYRPSGDGLGLRVFGDLVRGKLSSGENLPRIPPSRIGFEVDWRRDPWSADVSAIRVSSQNRVSPLETTTPGYTRVDAELAYAWAWERGRTISLYLQGSNLLDKDIRVHTSYLKAFTPLMGRSYLAGVRAMF